MLRILKKDGGFRLLAVEGVLTVVQMNVPSGLLSAGVTMKPSILRKNFYREALAYEFESLKPEPTQELGSISNQSYRNSNLFEQY